MQTVTGGVGDIKHRKIATIAWNPGDAANKARRWGRVAEEKKTNAIVDLVCVVQPCNKVEITNHEQHTRTLIRGALNKCHSLSWTLVQGSYFASLLRAVSSKTCFCIGFKGWMLYLIFLFWICLVAVFLFQVAISLQIYYQTEVWNRV